MSLSWTGYVRRESSPQAVQASLKVIIAGVKSSAAATTTSNRLGHFAFRHCGGREA